MKKKKINIKNLLLLIIVSALAIYAIIFLYNKLFNNESIGEKITNIKEEIKEKDKLEDLGYSKEEIKTIRNNMSDEEINKIDKYYENLSNYSSISYFHIENIDRYDKLINDYSLEETIMRVNTSIDKPFYSDIKTIEDPKSLEVLVNKYYALPKGYAPDDLVDVEGESMRKVAAENMKKMAKDMRDNGLTINMISGYRSESTQKSLYNRYASSDGQEEADTYSARPSHSEHQTGLAMDISDNWNLYEGFEDTPEFRWLSDNAYKYGFILRFKKDKVYMTGYIYEPWHYRYVGEKIAKIIHDEDITYEEYCVKYKGLF